MNYVYETMYILRPDLGEELVTQATAKYQNLVRDNGGTDVESLHRGKRRLAYEIQRQRDGIYIQLNYKGNGTQVAILERAMRLSEEVIRYLTIKQEVPKEEPAEEQEVAEVEA